MAFIWKDGTLHDTPDPTDVGQQRLAASGNLNPGGLGSPTGQPNPSGSGYMQGVTWTNPTDSSMVTPMNPLQYATPKSAAEIAAALGGTAYGGDTGGGQFSAGQQYIDLGNGSALNAGLLGGQIARYGIDSPIVRQMIQQDAQASAGSRYGIEHPLQAMQNSMQYGQADPTAAAQYAQRASFQYKPPALPPPASPPPGGSTPKTPTGTGDKPPAANTQPPIQHVQEVVYNDKGIPAFRWDAASGRYVPIPAGSEANGNPAGAGGTPPAGQEQKLSPQSGGGGGPLGGYVPNYVGSGGGPSSFQAPGAADSYVGQGYQQNNPISGGSLEYKAPSQGGGAMGTYGSAPTTYGGFQMGSGGRSSAPTTYGGFQMNGDGGMGTYGDAGLSQQPNPMKTPRSQTRQVTSGTGNTFGSRY